MSLVDDVIRYYAARATTYDLSAGYTDEEAERLRVPIKARYRETFAGHDVLEIACGTGYWTPSIAARAKSVLAVDINPALIAQAKARCRDLSHVSFWIADAYALGGVPQGFSAAVGIWWWSHIPRERLADFLSSLHGRLRDGAFVLFVDQLPYDGPSRRVDALGNVLEERFLPDGSVFEIVKNFPTADEIRSALAGIADKVEYVERPDEEHWSVSYHVKRNAPA